MAAYMIDDFDEEFVKVPRVFRDRTRALDTLDDTTLIRRYRLSRDAIFQLLDIIRPDLLRATQRSHALSPETQLLITLRYYSKGGFFSELADIHGVAVSSVSRVFQTTTDAICSKLSLIKFPKTNEERQKIKEGFYRLANFPNVIGCVDGTLIPIIRPPVNEEAAYVSRKHSHAVNIQAVCDSDLRFTNVVCKWPGSTHDSFIFANSEVGQYLERAPANGWLLGDSGYACRPWLLTPLLSPSTRPQERYNGSHIKTRNTVERAFGLLKSRFRCLHKTTGCLPFKVAKCHRIIYACCQLHNFCIDRRLPHPPLDEEEDADDNNRFDQGNVRQDGTAIRNRLIQQCFS